MGFSMHPAARLACWLTAILLGQGLAWPTLGYALAAVMAGGVLIVGATAIREGMRLVWRVRWLMVALVLVFAWGVPGEPLGGDGRLSPTWEGLQLVALHLGRLILTLLLVGALLANLSREALSSALFAFVLPLRRVGVDCERGVVRMALVLRFVDGAGVADWRLLLREDGVPTEHAELTSVLVEHHPLRWGDWFVLGACCALVGGAVYLFMGKA